MHPPLPRPKRLSQGWLYQRRIDWGDMASGDRATDLAAIWMLLPSRESRERAMAEYGAAPRAA